MQTRHVGEKPGKVTLRRETAELLDAKVEIVVLEQYHRRISPCELALFHASELRDPYPNTGDICPYQVQHGDHVATCTVVSSQRCREITTPSGNQVAIRCLAVSELHLIRTFRHATLQTRIESVS